MTSDTTFITNCTLTTAAGTFIVSQFSMILSTDSCPSCSCQIVIGKNIIGKKKLTYTVDKLLKLPAGTEAELELTGKFNGTDFTKKLFSGYVAGIGVSSSSGGGSSANLSYIVSLTLTHISGALSAYTIGNRIFTPTGQQRSPFLKNVDNCALSQHDSVDSKAAKKNNVSKHIIEIVQKFFEFDVGQLKSASPIKFPPITAPDCILNLQTQSQVATQGKIHEYIQETSKACLEQAQNGGNFFALLTSMCNAFMLHVLPTYNGLHISPILPAFQFSQDKCISLPKSYLMGFNKGIMHRDVFPADAIWVPNEKHIPHLAKNAVSSKVSGYSPLTDTTKQPHYDYFKYPDNENRTNGEIIEPPMIIKKLLLGESDVVPKSDPSVESSTTTKVEKTPKKQIDKRESPVLNRRIGILSAKLLYCEYAFQTMSVSLDINVAAYISGALDVAIQKTDIKREAPYGLVGTIVKFFVPKDDGSFIEQVGYCQSVSMSMDQPSNTFTFSLNIANVRSVTEDTNTSIKMSEKLLYTEIKNS